MNSISERLRTLSGSWQTSMSGKIAGLSNYAQKTLSERFEKIQSKKMCSKTRRAQTNDTENIRKLFIDATYRLFGNVDIDELIHLCYMTMVLEDVNRDIIAAICVNNYPNVPSVPPWSWKEWLYNKYRMESVNSRNSLWVHLAVFDPKYKYSFLDHLLKALFVKCPYVQYILFVIPPNTYTTEWLEKGGMQITPIGYSDPKTVQTLYVFLRQHYVLSYKIRQAVVEDNDDLIPLVHTHCKRLKQLYGEYYIAEIIMNKEKYKDRYLVVAEYEGQAVAMLCLNKHVNYKMLNAGFQLLTFYGLMKASSRDVLKTKVHFHDHRDDSSRPSITEMIALCTTENVEHEETSAVEEEINDEQWDLNTASLIVADIIIEEIAEEEEEEVEEEEEETPSHFEYFKGHPFPEISSDILEFTEKQLDIWKKAKRKSQGIIAAESTFDDESIFNGAPNAFALEIAAAQPQHEAALNQLLESSFELFPDRSYCVITIPSQTYSFPLISKTFVRIPPKPGSDFPQELYVVHHSAISSELTVRPATDCDLNRVDIFLKTITRGPWLWSKFKQAVKAENNVSQPFLLYCDKSIIGVAILSDLEDVEYITSHYQLATWTDMAKHKPGAHGQIECFALSPIFHRHVRFFLLELHRLSDYSLLCYIIRPTDLEAASQKALACVLGDLLPVIPSKMPEYSKIETSSWCLPEAVGRVERPYAIYISTPVYCSLTRHEINDRIIVVGASEVGIAFMVSLIFHNNPNIRVTFNNIILVSTHGLVPYRSNRFRDFMKPTTGEAQGYYLSLLSLPTYVTVITGVMSAIDRKNKTITVNNAQLSYDMLFLTCGKQYQMPKRSEEKRGKTIERPNNVFIVNTENDIDAIILQLKKLILDNLPGYVIVYGYTLDAYCCLDAIMEIGIPYSRIYFIQPYPSNDDESHQTIFNDNDVEETVNSTIKRLGVQMFIGYRFIDWTFDDKYLNITSITFESLNRMLDVECMAVFMYEEKKISPRTFTAIANANLMFDGGLVIDTNCRTNDPNIYAAGTITKYSRRYYADHMKHAYFNQAEIGHKLGEQILNKLMGDSDKSTSQNLLSPCKDDMVKRVLVPRYIAPLMVFAKLPGQINYMNVKKPGVEIPLDVAMTADDYGQVLTSGNCKNIEKQGYFRLHLNHYNTVETITCLTKAEIEKVNLTHIWGKHEKMLNNLVKRFEMITITDLFDFFSEPWTYAIYHDRFDKLHDDITDILTSLTETEGSSIIEDIIEKLSSTNWKMLTKGQFHDIQRKFLGSEYQKKVEDKVLEFLIDNYIYLPMYANPTAINVILAGYEESTMFKRV